jgi:stress response protein SCP2
VEKGATVGDLIRTLEGLTGAGKEGRKIAKLQLRGEDLAVDRLVETVSSSCFHPINVVCSGDGNPSGLSADQEAMVRTMLGATGGNRHRDEVIAVLQRNNWDEAAAGHELADQPQ